MPCNPWMLWQVYMSCFFLTFLEKLCKSFKRKLHRGSTRVIKKEENWCQTFYVEALIVLKSIQGYQNTSGSLSAALPGNYKPAKNKSRYWRRYLSGVMSCGSFSSFIVGLCVWMKDWFYQTILQVTCVKGALRFGKRCEVFVLLLLCALWRCRLCAPGPAGSHGEPWPQPEGVWGSHSSLRISQAKVKHTSVCLSPHWFISP